MASGPTAGSHPGVPDRWFNLRGFGNPVCCSWGPADYDSATNTITVTYQITEGSGAPPGAKGAAEAGVQAWITAINSREDATWHFNLEPFTGAGPSGLGSLHWILSCHRGGKDGKGCGEPPPNGGNRDEPDINIKIKKGGATIAGSAKRFADNQGFIKKVNITVSGAFAFIPTPLAQIEGGHRARGGPRPGDGPPHQRARPHGPDRRLRGGWPLGLRPGRLRGRPSVAGGRRPTRFEPRELCDLLIAIGKTT